MHRRRSPLRTLLSAGSLFLLAMVLAAPRMLAQPNSVELVMVNLTPGPSTALFSIDVQGNNRATIGRVAGREATSIAYTVDSVIYTITVRDSIDGRLLATTATALKTSARNYLVYTGHSIVIWNFNSDRFALFNGTSGTVRLNMTLAFGALHTPTLGSIEPVRAWSESSSEFKGLITINAGGVDHFGGIGVNDPIFIATAADGTPGVFAIGEPAGRTRWPLRRWSTDSSVAPMRLRVVNASRTASRVDVTYGSGSTEINGIGPMTASRSYPIKPGPLEWRVRINGGAWRPVVTTPLQRGTVYTILVTRAPSDSGEVTTIFDRPASNLLDTIHGFGGATPGVDQAHLRGTVLPRSPGIFWGEFAGAGGRPGHPFQLKREGWPNQMASILPIDTGFVYVDIHGSMGMPMLDRIAFGGVHAGKRYRILVESRADSSFDAWLYDELDTAAQMLIVGDHLPLSTIEGDVRLLNLSLGSFRATMGNDTGAFSSHDGTLSPWIRTRGGRLVLVDAGNGGSEVYNDSIALVRKGLMTLVAYSTGNTAAPGVLSLGTYPLPTNGNYLPQVRFAVALDGADSVSLELIRYTSTVARFEQMGARSVAAYRFVDTYEAPDEFRVNLVESRLGRTIATSTLGLKRNSYTTFIVATGPALAGISGSSSSGPLYLWALREFPDEPTTSALTLLGSTARIADDIHVRPSLIWPNPSRNTISIRVEPGRALAGTLVVVDMLGGVAAELGEHRLAAEGGTIETNVSGLVPGAYTLVIRNRDGVHVVLGEIIRR